MAYVTRFPLIRHLRSEPSRHVILWSRGRRRRSGRGLALWFRPLAAAIAELPVDDRELPFLFHARSRDFQDVTVQGVITWRVADPEVLADRVDFSIDLATGNWREKPLEQLAEILTHAAQQGAWEVLAAHDVRPLLERGVEMVRTRVSEELLASAALEQMGLQVVAVAVSSVQPTSELEKALQTPTLESIQQQADEATFRRRALAVEKERAIGENELASRVELARRESELIAQQGENAKSQAREEADALRIGGEGQADLRRLEMDTEAVRVRTIAAAEAEAQRLAGAAEAESLGEVETARVTAERERMQIYGGLEPHVLMGLAAREFAGKLERVEHLSLAPDRVGQVLADLLQSGSRWLEREGAPQES